MAVRREAVRLEVEDHFTREMLQAAAAAETLDRSLNSLSGSAVTSARSVNKTQRDVDGLGKTSTKASAGVGRVRGEVDGLGRSAQRSGTSINQLTGRLRIIADLVAVLGPSLAPIGAVAIPGLAGLASQAGFAVLGLGSLIVAAQGVGDALKAVNTAALEPTADNLEKARVAMAKIGPDAQAFVTRFQEIRPVLGDIRDAAARGWFPGLTESLTSLEQIAPQVAYLFETIGRVGGNLVAEGAAAFAGPGWADFRSFVAREAPRSLDQLGRILGNVAKGLGELWMAFGPLNASFSSWLLDAARSFAEWADGLTATEGFQEFVDYIRTNGPRVADTLGAVGNAVVQIVQAIAPLGGPSLKIIETFADAISTIADSDLGTPILAGVAALALYNRSLQVTAALQTRLTGASAVGDAMAAGGIFGGTRAGVRQARGGLAVLTGDLRSMSREYGKVSRAQSVMLSGLSRTSSAAQRTSSTLRSMGKGTALVGGLALATTGVADSFKFANTASLAMMGTIAGPWGAAVGGGIGLLIDLAKAAGDSKGAFEEALKTTTAAASLGDLATAEAGLAAAKKTRDKYLRDEKSSRSQTVGTGVALARAQGQDITTADVIKGPSGEAQKAQKDYDKAAEAVENLRNKMATAALTEQGYTADLLATANAAGVSASELLASVAAIEARTQAAMGAFSAETRWRQALKSATEQAKGNNAGINGSTKAALENRSALEQLAGAWANQRDAMVQNGASAGAVEQKYRGARRAFIETATAMGVPIQQARRLANQLLAIPEKRAVDVTINGGQRAIDLLRQVKSEMAGIKDKTVRLNYMVNRLNGAALQAGGGRDGDPSTPYWSGGYTGDGGKYEPAGIVHRGEVVLPREIVKRDWDLLANRYGHLPGFAGGGMVGGWGTAVPPWSPFPPALNKSLLPQVAIEVVDFGKGLKGLNRALKATKKTLDDEKAARDAIVSTMGTLRDAVAGKITSDLFGETDVWTRGGSIADANAQLDADTARGNRLNANIAALRAKGLTGPALDALLATADEETIANFAAGTRAELTGYRTRYEQRAKVASTAGTAAANAAYGREKADADARVKRIENKLDGIEKAIKAEHKEDRQARRRGSGDSARNRKRP
ncbi:hypothetical protein [Pimelobacter simplex]|uniref:hypothetical protein n=1 Tax=Nocardioides simplex TaxID=2045 RepID=UPI0021503023|nr:hypothetical protein [Pimelobacter simplex]UUW97909.1 hypothetical protein M0M48_10680 [Pimelobacter simplex]